MRSLKKIAAKLPLRWQSELKRLHYSRRIRKGVFRSSETEYDMLPQFITSGDWVLEVGANVGHYTKRFSELVGPCGRVIAFEPVPETFSLLAANAQLFANANVSLINVAVSDSIDVVGMSIPKFSTGLKNYYQAHLANASDSSVSVLALSLDAIFIEQRIALVKIDAEGHEEAVLRGIKELIQKYQPVLIIESASEGTTDWLSSLGYVPERLPDSPNILFRPLRFYQ